MIGVIEKQLGALGDEDFTRLHKNRGQCCANPTGPS
jgi:hypothetical protein